MSQNNMYLEQNADIDHSFKIKDIKKIILILFILGLPFSQALTINLLFPLKISEVAIFCFVVYFFFKVVFEKDMFLKSDFITRYLLTFILVVLTSTCYNFFITYNYPLNLDYIRLSRNANSLLKFGYLVIAFIAMQMTIIYVESYSIEKALKWFFLAAVLSSIYAWYLFFSSALNIPVLLLPGMDNPPQSLNLSFGSIIRCGTFKEGNYMGLFLFIGGVLARYRQKIALSNFLFISIITTFSTVSFICVIFYFLLTFFNKRKSILKVVAVFFVVATVLTLLVVKSEDFRSNVVNKIFASEDNVENQNDVFSRLDRLNSTQIGINLFLDNPIFGVGTGNYDIHFNHYNLLPKFGDGDYKKIPNNVYIEVLCESGIIAFSMFIGLIIIIVKQAQKTKNKPLVIGTVISFIYLIAFPTYTVLYIWFFWGILITEAKRVEINIPQ